jgi:hypothetical protein
VYRTKLGSFFCCILLTLGWLAAPSAWANQWASSVGEARDVQNRTHDLYERVSRSFPYSPVAHSVMHLDNAACQLVDAVKCGAAWHQVQASLRTTCSLAGQLNGAINQDCDVRNDRRVRDYMLDLSKRIERLRCSLDKDYERTQPSFCAPVHRVPSYRPPLGSFPMPRMPLPGYALPHKEHYPNGTYGFERDRFSSGPRNAPFGSAPFESAPFDSAPHYGSPLDRSRDPAYRELPNGGEFGPEALPPGSEIGPIQYRINHEAPRNGQRAAAIAQIGLEVLRMISN